jgi:hypothetical protein
MIKEIPVAEPMPLRTQDVELICKKIGSLINQQLNKAKKSIKLGQYQDLSVGLRDAGDWGMIVASVAAGHIRCVESLRDHISRLDTEARAPWFKILDTIQDR